MIDYLASEKKRNCDWCSKKIKKGDWFYLDKNGYPMSGNDIIICDKCGHEQDELEKDAMGYYDPVD